MIMGPIFEAAAAAVVAVACRAWFAGLGLLLFAVAISTAARGQSVVQYHGAPGRGGNFVVPSLTWERARGIHLDAGFHPRFPAMSTLSRSTGSRREC